MEWKSSSVQAVLYLSCVLILVCQLSGSAGYPVPDNDYEQHDQAGMREFLAELERQGGLTAPMVPRSYNFRTNPNHQLMRKSQRSNTLRLRFGKRSAGMGEEVDPGMFQEGPESAALDNLHHGLFQPQQQSQRFMEPNVIAHGQASVSLGSGKGE